MTKTHRHKCKNYRNRATETIKPRMQNKQKKTTNSTNHNTNKTQKQTHNTQASVPKRNT